MKILVLCPRFPFPLEKGDKLRMFHQLRYLSKEHEVMLIALNEEKVEPEDLEKIKDTVSAVKVFYLKKRTRGLALIKKTFSSMPLQVAYYYDKRIHNQIKEVAKAFKPDHVFCQLTRMSEYARDLPYPKTLDYMDAFGVGMDRRSEVVSGLTSLVYKLEANRMKRYETKIYDSFDSHTVISMQDQKQIKTPNDNPITVVPNGIDVSYFKPLQEDKDYEIGFVGNMGYPPNIDAAEYLINEVKPRLSSKYRYLIAGARPDKRVKLLAGKYVTITGWIDDVRIAYAKCKIFVAPLWSGTGQQNKILEAMAMGIPCITSESVNNAIGAEHRKEIMVANSKEEFVECVEILLNDENIYKDIKQNALTFVTEKYSWEQSIEQLTKLFSKKEES